MNTPLTDHLSKRLHFKKGEYIFKRGDQRDDAFIIVEGSVAIISNTPSGAEEIGSMLSEGDIFGEMALMEPGARTAAARAVADTEVYAISREAIKERMTGLDPVLSILFALLVDRYRKTRIYIPESADLPDPESVLAHLKEVANKERSGETVSTSGGIFGDIDHQRQEALNELGMEQKINNALKTDQFVPWLQPILALENQKIIGFEALARWIKPNSDLVPPFEFIPAAERLGLVQHIDFTILDKVAIILEECEKSLIDDQIPYIGVNLSGHHFEDEVVVGMVKAALKEHKINPKNIRFEITESALIKDPSSAKTILGKLKDLGATIALDDFGTGYSSLSYLHQFPIDAIKIDRSFVSQLKSDTKSVDIIKAIVGIADSFKVEVIAEGIESEIEMHTLRSIGCHYGQGFFFGKPAPKEEVLSSLFSDAAQ